MSEQTAAAASPPQRAWRFYPGAVNSNYGKDGWREDRARDKVPDMFPENPAALVELIGRLGIDNDTLWSVVCDNIPSLLAELLALKKAADSGQLT